MFAYHNNLLYTRFVTDIEPNDFFVKEEELIFTKQELKHMLDNDEINEVQRD